MTTSRVDVAHPVLTGTLRATLAATLLTGALAVGALLGVSSVTMTPAAPATATSAVQAAAE